jgi:hypothetical protein
VTFETDGVLRGVRAHLLGLHGAVNVVAIAALDQAFIHPVVKGHVELSFLLKMTSVTELGLALLQQELVRLRVM